MNAVKLHPILLAISLSILILHISWHTLYYSHKHHMDREEIIYPHYFHHNARRQTIRLGGTTNFHQAHHLNAIDMPSSGCDALLS